VKLKLKHQEMDVLYKIMKEKLRAVKDLQKTKILKLFKAEILKAMADHLCHLKVLTLPI